MQVTWKITEKELPLLLCVLFLVVLIVCCFYLKLENLTYVFYSPIGQSISKCRTKETKQAKTQYTGVAKVLLCNFLVNYWWDFLELRKNVFNSERKKKQ